MDKVKNIYYDDNHQSEFGTGLFLEMEDGKVFRHQSDSPLIKFERIKELPED